MELMFAPLKRYVDFQGRSRRTEFWLWFVFQLIVAIIFGILKSALGTGSANFVQLLNTIFSLAILLPSLAVGVRRFHDTNRTGWWIVLPLVVFIVAFIIYLATSGAGAFAFFEKLGTYGSTPTEQQSMEIVRTMMPMLWVFLAWWAASLVTFVFCVLDGTPGTNRFGPDPKGRGGNINVF